MKKSVLIFGGSSDERLVSVASAQNLSRQYAFNEVWFMGEDGALSRTSAQELGAHQNPFTDKFVPQGQPFVASLREAVPHLKGVRVFLGFHGTEGEDGTIQELFEKNGIAFTGSGSRASRLCFDKQKAKEIVAAAGLPTAQGLTVSPDESFEAAARKLVAFLDQHKKMILKPVANGSSVGLYIISDRVQLEAAIRKIIGSPYGLYLAEAFVTGRELTVGVLQTQGQTHDGGELVALPASEVIMESGRNFDYEGKYLGLGSTEVTPAAVTPEQMEAAKQLSLNSHKALGCYGYTRTDMILTSTGLIYLETNTLPGMTKASFVPQQLEVMKLGVREFIESQLALAETR